MAWESNYVISGGEYAGSLIGITDYLPQGVSTDTWIGNGESYRNQTGSLEWYNTDFNKQIEITSEITAGVSPQGGKVLAKVNIVNSNKEIVGRFVFKLLLATFNYCEVCAYIEDANGNNLGYVPRNTPQNGYQIPIESGQPTRHFYLALVVHKTSTQTIIGWAVNGSSIEDNSSTWKWGNKQFRGGFFDIEQIETLYGISGVLPEPKNKSPEFGPASEGGGGYNDTPSNPHGTFDNSSDKINVPALPSVGVTSAGFINVYKVSEGELTSLGEKLFPHFLPAEILNDPAQLTTPEVLSMFLKALYGTLISPVGTSVYLADNLGVLDVLMNGKLIDYILDCHILPVDINAPTTEGLRVGYRQFNDLVLAKATSDYVEVDCGSLSIGEYWGNFLDYSNCLCKIFLPFVGFVDIAPEMWNGGTIKIVYHINVVDGSFQAYVVSTSSKSELDETVVAQYGGVCCIHFPITGLQYSNVVAGLVNGSLGAVASGMGGNPAGVATNLANMSMLRPDAPMSNGYNASSSFLSVRKPYLLIERPWAQFSEKYPKEMGLPLNVTCLLSTVHGFTVVDNPVLNIICSDAEYQELCSLLKSGVIL